MVGRNYAYRITVPSLSPFSSTNIWIFGNLLTSLIVRLTLLLGTMSRVLLLGTMSGFSWNRLFLHTLKFLTSFKEIHVSRPTMSGSEDLHLTFTWSPDHHLTFPGKAYPDPYPFLTLIRRFEIAPKLHLNFTWTSPDIHLFPLCTYKVSKITLAFLACSKFVIELHESLIDQCMDICSVRCVKLGWQGWLVTKVVLMLWNAAFVSIICLSFILFLFITVLCIVARMWYINCFESDHVTIRSECESWEPPCMDIITISGSMILWARWSITLWAAPGEP